MSKDHDIWKYTNASYAFPLLMGIIFIFINYKNTHDPAVTTQVPRSFPLLLSIIVPLVGIWLIATYGAICFKKYASSIRESADGKSLNDIANGLLLLVIYIVLLPMNNSIQSLVVNTPYLRPSVFLGNHVPLAFALISGYLLYRGSKKLAGIVPHKLTTSRRATLLSVISGLFFAGFIWRFYITVPNLQPVNGIPKFSLPVGVLLFTYVLPHIVLWVSGLLACRNLAHYAYKTPGVIYKALFRDLYKGILLVYICIFLAQIFIISTISFAKFNIGIVLIYGLLLLAAFGFILVARGAKKLAKLEK